MPSTHYSPAFETRWSWLIGAILFGSTLYFSNNVLLLLLLPILFVLPTNIPSLYRDKFFFILFAFVVAGMLNATLGMAVNNKSVSDGLRALITIPFILITINLSHVLEDFRVRRAIYVFILLECVVGGLQFYFGSPHPFPRQFNEAFVDYSDFSGFEALYFNRAYGLSASSSTFAQKILILVVMLLDGDLRKFRPSVRAVVICLAVIGLIVTFNRTVISVLVLFVILWLARSYCKTWKSYLLFLVPPAALFGLFSATYIADSVRDTLSFGVTAGGLDARFVIWEDALSFLNKHLLLGNNSIHILFDYYGSENHAHNSFLQMIATHGLLIAMLLFLFVLVKISRSNFPVVITFMVYSLTQYGIFWAISFMDIVFYYYLRQRGRPFAWPDAPYVVRRTDTLLKSKPQVEFPGTSATAR